MTRLILWRHGHTEWNGQLRVQGHSDVPLSELGRHQATEAAPLLAALAPDLIVSSDLSRCTQTATALAQLTDLPVATDSRLRERAYGDWEGLTMAEIAQHWPESYQRKQAGADAADMGHGIERPAEVMKRMGEALRELAEGHPGATAVVVSHGGAIRYGMFDLLGWPAEQLRSVYALVNCHYSEVRLDPGGRGWVLRCHNVGVAEGPPGYE